jgi:hypothetical protein
MKKIIHTPPYAYNSGVPDLNPSPGPVPKEKKKKRNVRNVPKRKK